MKNRNDFINREGRRRMYRRLKYRKQGISWGEFSKELEKEFPKMQPITVSKDTYRVGHKRRQLKKEWKA